MRSTSPIFFLLLTFALTGSLRNFVFHPASTIGHLNGEGHCDDLVVSSL